MRDNKNSPLHQWIRSGSGTKFMEFRFIIDFSQWITHPVFQRIRERFISWVRRFHSGELIPDHVKFNASVPSWTRDGAQPAYSHDQPDPSLTRDGAQPAYSHDQPDPSATRDVAQSAYSRGQPDPSATRDVAQSAYSRGQPDPNSTRDNTQSVDSRVQPVQLNTASRPLSDRPAAIKANNAIMTKKGNKATTLVKKQASAHTPRDDLPPSPPVSITLFNCVFPTLQY